MRSPSCRLSRWVSSRESTLPGLGRRQPGLAPGHAPEHAQQVLDRLILAHPGAARRPRSRLLSGLAPTCGSSMITRVECGGPEVALHNRMDPARSTSSKVVFGVPAHGGGGRLGDGDDAQVVLGAEPDRERVRERALLVDDDGGDPHGPAPSGGLVAEPQVFAGRQGGGFRAWCARPAW